MFVSCGKASKNDNTIIGKWSHVSHGNTNTLEFLDNGKINATFYKAVFSSDITTSFDLDNPFPSISSWNANNFTGNYVIKDDKVNISWENSEIKEVWKFSVNSITLTVTPTGGDVTNGIKYSTVTTMYKRVK